jgi:heat shock protein HslJ
MQAKHRLTRVAVILASIAIGPLALAQEMPKGGSAPAPLQPRQFPTNVQWVLKSLNGKPVGDNEPTLQLDTQLRMRGFAGCNTFSATAYPGRNQGIAVGPLALTNKECDKATMEFEKTYLLGLRTSQQWQVKDGFLYLVGEKSELKFERALF